MKLGVSQSPVQSDTGQQLHPSRARVLHHDGHVMESAFSLGQWTRSRGPWWPGPRWVVAPSRSGREERRWPGRGGCGGDGGWGRGGRRDPGALLRWTSLWSCSDKFQQYCSRFRFSTVVGQSCFACRDSIHSANCAVLRQDSSGATLGPGLTCPLLCNARCAVLGCQGRRHPCRGADAVSLGPGHH